MSRPGAVLDRQLKDNETAIAIHDDAARKIADVVREHVYAAQRLSEVALTDARSAITVYGNVERALIRSGAFDSLPLDVRVAISVLPERLRAVDFDCACIDKQNHTITCELHGIYKEHRELIERYRAHNVALVSGKGA